MPIRGLVTLASGLTITLFAGGSTVGLGLLFCDLPRVLHIAAIGIVVVLFAGTADPYHLALGRLLWDLFNRFNRLGLYRCFRLRIGLRCGLRGGFRRRCNGGNGGGILLLRLLHCCFAAGRGSSLAFF